MSDSAQPAQHAWGFLTPPEVRFLDAAVERLIPTDELGPGARDAGVTIFIDRQMCTPYGVFARAYRMGPWHEGTPQQGWQCPLTPQEVYRTAIREIDAHCVKQHGKPFCFLTGEQQDTLLKSLQQGKFEMQAVDAKVFFDLLLKNTNEGYFSDPMYGGNRNKVGWRLVGFPGVAASNYPSFMGRDFDEKLYEVEPVSILDIVEKRVKVDAQGFPIHTRINSNSGS